MTILFIFIPDLLTIFGYVDMSWNGGIRVRAIPNMVRHFAKMRSLKEDDGPAQSIECRAIALHYGDRFQNRPFYS